MEELSVLMKKLSIIKKIYLNKE